MKKFLLKFSFLVLCVFLFLYYLATQADGYTDSYYVKFTAPRQQALILGNSKALHGMIPQVFDSVLKTAYPNQGLFNYAFSMGHSPYGPVYFKAIKEKLDANSKNGLFILTVDPWSVSAPKGAPNDSANYIENGLFLGKTRMFNASPNFDYLLRSYEGPWGNIIFNKFKKQKGPGFVHHNGWLEVDIAWDSTTAEENMAIKEDIYRNDYLPSTEPSALRLAYLEKTIRLLKTHGDVYLLRLPVHEKIKVIDNNLMPDFDMVMEQLSQKNNIRYINLIDSNKNYLFNDGVHLYKSSGKQFSYRIASLILEDKQQAKR
jgi:hypothetical protein